MKYYGCVYRYDWRGNYTPTIYRSEQGFDTPEEAFEDAKREMNENRRWTIRERIFGAVEKQNGELLPMRARMEYDSTNMEIYNI